MQLILVWLVCVGVGSGSRLKMKSRFSYYTSDKKKNSLFSYFKAKRERVERVGEVPLMAPPDATP